MLTLAYLCYLTHIYIEHTLYLRWSGNRGLTSGWGQCPQFSCRTAPLWLMVAHPVYRCRLFSLLLSSFCLTPNRSAEWHNGAEVVEIVKIPSCSSLRRTVGTTTSLLCFHTEGVGFRAWYTLDTVPPGGDGTAAVYPACYFCRFLIFFVSRSTPSIRYDL